MRRPQGYGQIICDSVSRKYGVDEYGRKITDECDTFTCGHCQRIVFVRPKERPEDVGGMCYQCMRIVCPQCTSTGKCDPFEEKKERVERTQDFRRWFDECS